jgi:hypothetical protein
MMEEHRHFHPSLTTDGCAQEASAAPHGSGVLLEHERLCASLGQPVKVVGTVTFTACFGRAE